MFLVAVKCDMTSLFEELQSAAAASENQSVTERFDPSTAEDESGSDDATSSATTMTHDDDGEDEEEVEVDVEDAQCHSVSVSCSGVRRVLLLLDHSLLDWHSCVLHHHLSSLSLHQ